MRNKKPHFILHLVQKRTGGNQMHREKELTA